MFKSFQINEKIDTKPCIVCSRNHSIPVNLIIIFFKNWNLIFWLSIFLQVVLYNKFSQLDNGTRALYTPKEGLIYIVFNGVEFVLEYNANVGTHIDVLVYSQSKTLEEALDMFHEHIMKHIQERCAAPNGCQGVTLLEGDIRTECVKQQLSFKQCQDQSILLEDLKQAILTIGRGYQHPWDELSEGGNVILHVACEFAIELIGRREIEDLVERGLKEG